MGSESCGCKSQQCSTGLWTCSSFYCKCLRSPAVKWTTVKAGCLAYAYDSCQLLAHLLLMSMQISSIKTKMHFSKSKYMHVRTWFLYRYDESNFPDGTDWWTFLEVWIMSRPNSLHTGLARIMADNFNFAEHSLEDIIWGPMREKQTFKPEEN